MEDGLLERRRRAVPRGLGTLHPLTVSRARGARLWDTDGKEYIDFVGGIGVLNVGHNHPRVVAAVRAQLEELTHTCFQVAHYRGYIELAERLNALVGAGLPCKSLLFSTGAEAVENAVKIARAYTNRPGVIAFTGGFHGRTLLGMSLTAAGAQQRQNFGPFAPEIYHCPFPYPYRGWPAERAWEALLQLLQSRIAPDRVAAVIIEPQLGEGGFVPAPAAFLTDLRRLTREHGIVLLLDEIQTGFGRTGKMFAFQHHGIEPDLVTLAKSLGGGLPLSAVVGRAEIMDAPLPGGLGGTYAGNPLACAAALAVLDVIGEERLLERAVELEQQLRQGLGALEARYPSVGEVRGLGAMLAFELVNDRNSREPATELAQRVIAGARERGLLLLPCGPSKNVIRILVPLVATPEEINLGLERLEAALAAALSA
jgi:4-aminobutyrate aminotransferase / (S)-3-amino-2-methylpropionate transaminase / 5-aminovalerate transaminase